MKEKKNHFPKYQEVRVSKNGLEPAWPSLDSVPGMMRKEKGPTKKCRNMRRDDQTACDNNEWPPSSLLQGAYILQVRENPPPP